MKKQPLPIAALVLLWLIATCFSAPQQAGAVLPQTCEELGTGSGEPSPSVDNLKTRPVPVPISSQPHRNCVFAVVRMPSHGASATVIHTEQGRSLLLSCAHAFDGPSARAPIQLDIPLRKARTARRARIRLLAVDHNTDLSLVEMSDGPLDYVAPVAPRSHVPGRRLLSVGYDEMQTPATIAAATIASVEGNRVFTHQRPWHGRSGGALLDVEAGYVIGVVQGYELDRRRRGIYASHFAIVGFLGQRSEPRMPEFLPRGPF